MVKRRHAAVLFGFGAVSLVVTAVGCGWIVGVEEFSGKDVASGGAGGNAAQSSGESTGSSMSTSGGSCSECVKADWTKTLKGDGDQVVDDIALNVNKGYIAIAGNLVGPTGQTSFGDPCPMNGTCPLVHQGGNDAFVAMIDAEGTPMWSQSLGDGADQFGAGVAVDSNDVTTLVGSFAGTIMLNGASKSSIDLNDIFVARYDGSGNPIGGQAFGGTGDQFPQDVVVDSSANIIMVGGFRNSFSFGACPLLNIAGTQDIFITKLAGDLSCMWSKSFGAGGEATRTFAVAVDAMEKSIVLTGRFHGSVNFGNGSLSATDSTDDLVIVKLDTNGNTLWAKSFACLNGTPEVRAVVTDNAGDVYITGFYDGTLDFVDGNNPMLTAADSKDAFVAKLSADGNALWSRSFGGAGNQSGESIAVGPNGDVFVTGAFTGSASFKGTTLASAGGDDVFLLHYDVIGTEKCGVRLGDGASQKGQGLIINGGKLLLGSNYQGTLDVQPTIGMGCVSSTSAAGTDVLLTFLTVTP